MKSVKEFLKRLIQFILMNALVIITLEAQPLEDLPAFPQAEGFGAYAKGSRGGKVIFVENLNDDGPGIMVFKLSGTGVVVAKISFAPVDFIRLMINSRFFL